MQKITQGIKDACIDFLVKNHNADMDNINISVSRGTDPNEVIISPNNMYSLLLFNGIHVPCDVVKDLKQFEYNGVEYKLRQDMDRKEALRLIKNKYIEDISQEHAGNINDWIKGCASYFSHNPTKDMLDELIYFLAEMGIVQD